MLAFVLSYAIAACKNEQARLETRSFSQGDNHCIVQHLPVNYDEANGKHGRFDYYRVIIQSQAKLNDSDINYVNFGMESSIKKIVSKDTLWKTADRLAFFQVDNTVVKVPGSVRIVYRKPQHALRNVKITVHDWFQLAVAVTGGRLFIFITDYSECPDFRSCYEHVVHAV